jgi:glycosyltransferase involved in cell wall biosynthesis
MPKILLVANTDWYLYRFRLSLACFLRDQGNEVVLVSPPGRYATGLRDAGFRWQAWNIGRQTINPVGELSAIQELVKVFQHERPDVVHLHTIKPVLYGSLAARFARVPIVVRSITGRGYIFLGNDLKARWLRPLIKGMYRLILREASSATIFENGTDMQYFVDNNLVSSSHTYVIQGVGVDTSYYHAFPESDQKPVVLLATRMLWDKGVETFVKAGEMLKPENLARFVLVGEPDLGNPASIDGRILKRWEQDGIIEWWGFREDMRAVFAESHLVTLPSLGEGVPTVLLEAAACSRAIVATDVPGCREVVKHGINGLLVPPKDPRALASAIKQLLENKPLRQRMGEEGRQLMVKRFSIQQINDQTLAVYRNLLYRPQT